MQPVHPTLQLTDQVTQATGTTLQRYSAVVQGLEAETTALRGACDAYVQAIVGKNAKIARRDATIQGLNHQVQDLTHQRDEARQTVETQKKTIAEKDDLIAQLQAQLEAANAAHALVQQRLQQFGQAVQPHVQSLQQVQQRHQDSDHAQRLQAAQQALAAAAAGDDSDVD